MKHLAVPLLNLNITSMAWSSLRGPDSEGRDTWKSRLLYRLIIIDTMWSEHMYMIKLGPSVIDVKAEGGKSGVSKSLRAYITPSGLFALFIVLSAPSSVFYSPSTGSVQRALVHE